MTIYNAFCAPDNVLFVYGNRDLFCVTLTQTVKVYFKLNGSVLIKNRRFKHCIAVAGVVVPGKTRMFSMHSPGIRVQHDESNCLAIQLIENKDPAERRLTRMVRGTTTTMGDDSEAVLAHNFISCAAIFHHKATMVTAEMKKRAKMIKDTSYYYKYPNGKIEVRFRNGLKIVHFPNGNTSITTDDTGITITMSPEASNILSVDDCAIVSSAKDFFARKDDMTMSAINGVVQPNLSVSLP